MNRPTRALLAGIAATVLVGLAGCAQPAQDETVTGWITRTATPIASLDTDHATDDLAPLARMVGDARIVGLGESTHGVAEEIALKHRTLRLLVEQLGFRSVAWEEDWTLGLEIDGYLRTGAGDPAALVARMSPQWQSREVVDVLRWLRAFNADRPDKVRFVGVEYYATPAAAYDAVDAYVARVAPDRLPALRPHLAAIRPDRPDVYAYIQAYSAVADKQPYLDHARQAYDIVAALPHPPGDPEHARALHTAAQIVSFHRHYQLSEAEALVHRDARAAENLQWWAERTGDRVAYWAAAPHTAAAPQLRISGPPADMRFPSAGSALRDRYGQQYRSIGYTVGHGEASLGYGQTATLPAPAPGRFEQPLDAAGPATFALDLHAPAPGAARAWLDSPAVFRGLPDRGPDAVIDGGAPAQWFDVIVHSRTATPTRPVP